MFRLFQCEDGSKLLEYADKRFRIGFSVELERSESGWYIVSKDGVGVSGIMLKEQLNAIDDLIKEVFLTKERVGK